MFQTTRIKWALPLAALFFAATSAFAGVTVSSPTPGTTSGSPVHFVASASSGHPIISMRIYVDNNSVFVTSSGSLNTSIPMSSGSHSVVVQAWDSAGGIYKSAETITVSGSAPPPSSTGVTVSSPTPGTTSSSPVHFVASASSSHPIISMRIYVDSNSVFVTGSGSLNTSVPMSSGTHSVVVQAWDSAGGIFKFPETITVSGSTAPPPPGTPVPGTAIVKSSIQKMTGWSSCTTCAGAGGNGPSANFSYQQFVGSPSLSGGSMRFNISGSTPYSDALWWRQLGGNNGATHFVYDLDFYMTAPQLSQALEFDVNQSNTVRKFIFGTECSIGRKEWDVWDTAGHTWIRTGVACPTPAAFKWHHLTWEFYRDGTMTHFVSVTMDGVKHYVNRAYNAQSSGATEVNVAFQMDGDYAMHAYSTWLDNVTLRYW